MLNKVGDYQFLSTKENILGKGAFGYVYRCQNIKTKEEYCLKMVAKAGAKNDLAKTLIREIDILKQLQTQNFSYLVQVYEVIEQGDHIYIIMEICDYDLATEFDMLKKKNIWYTEDDQIEIIQQIVKGFQSLFKMKIVHRDIKPQNILVKIIDKGTMSQRKITDFGFSRFLDDLQKKGNLTKVGTPSYAAPQLFFDPEFSGKCDIFSYGAVFYQIVHKGQSISPSKNSMEQLKVFLWGLQKQPIKCKIQEGEYKQELSTLVERMLKFSEDDRINFEEIFTHPIMKIQIGQNTQDSIFYHILKPEWEYIEKRNQIEQAERINSRLERINQVLEVFFRKFLFYQNLIQQINDINIVTLYLYQLGLNQLTYAMGIIHANLSDIHLCFKENNDIFHFLEILEECQQASQDDFSKKRFREEIGRYYLNFRKEFSIYMCKLKQSLIQSQQIEQYKELIDDTLTKRIDESSIYALLGKQKFGGQKLEQQLIKATNLETLFPIEKYQKINLDQIFPVEIQ